MNEGGQSSTGQVCTASLFLSPLLTHSTNSILSPKLIDFMITTHPAYPELQNIAADRNVKIHIILAEALEALRVESAKASKKNEGEYTLTELTKDIHFYPDLHGE